MKLLIKTALCFPALLFLWFGTAGAAPTIWNSDFTTFDKANRADFTLEANQDRITSTVWLTRGNNKALFNAAVESSASGNSPIGTEWASGTTAEYDQLIYEPFVTWLDGKRHVGLNIINYSPAVLHLIEDDVYIDIEFTSWSSGNSGGGFSYIRATSPVPVPGSMVLLGFGLLGLAGVNRRKQQH